MNMIIKFVEGNPGCISFLTSIKNELGEDTFEETFVKMDLMGIRGAKAYMVWNDCCGRDTKKAVTLIEKAFADNSLKKTLIENLNQVRACPMDI